MFLQLGNDLQRVARNRQLLVGRDAQHLDRGIVRADDADRAALVLRRVDLHAQIAEVLGDGGAGGREEAAAEDLMKSDTF